MLRIAYKTSISFREIIKKIDIKSKKVESEIMKLGIDTAEKMKSTIKKNKVRPQAGEPTKLENSIDMEKIQEGNNIVGWGVGNIDKMDREAPGWKAVNFGSSHMVGKHLPVGGFAPGEVKPSPDNFREGRWKKGGGNYSPIVTKPIPPMNYVEKTIHWLSGAIDKITSILRR